MKRMFIAILMGIFSIYAFADQIQNRGKIDREIKYSEDVTGDGIPDDIVLKIRTDNILDKVSWSLIVKSSGKTIYEKRSIDKNNNIFFRVKDSDLCDGRGFVKCKMHFYTNMLGVSIVPSSQYNSDGLFDGREYQIIELMKRHGLSKDKVVSAMLYAENKVKSGAAVLVNFVINTDMKYPLEMFIPELGGFIAIYED